MTSNKSSFMIRFKDGSIVDICAKGGANAYLRKINISEMNHFSHYIKQLRKMQHNKKMLNPNEKQQIILLHSYFNHVAQSDPVLFRETVPESEIKCWLDYTISEIKRFTAMPEWIKTGTLETHDMYALSNCLPMFSHALAVVLAFESDFFEALGALAKTRKRHDGRALPDHQISEWISFIVCNCFIATQFRFDNSWPSERSFRKLDDCGVLEEFLRCSTVPTCIQGQDAAQMAKDTFNELLADPVTLSSRFKRSDACGKVVRAILEGKDGSKTPSPVILRRIQEIGTYMDSMDGKADGSDHGLCFSDFCRKCRKMDASDAGQASLMKCSRCKSAYYCSKACQKADWKDHKKNCEPTTKSYRKQTSVIQELFEKFIQDQYVDIMVKLVRECDKTGTAKQDMLVHLDFRVNEDGIIPAMQKPPIFDVTPTRCYLDPSFQAELPRWVADIPQNRKVQRENIESRVSMIKTQYEKRTPRGTLFYVSYKEGEFSINIECNSMSSNILFSDLVFEAFRSAIHEDNMEPMYRLLDRKQAASLGAQLAKKYGILRRHFPDVEPLR